jgi:methylenetetrahydrofolate reductase (NADPH)
MKLSENYKNRFTISFEFFPPKTPQGEKNLMKEIAILALYKPAFVSVTYGAGGSTRSKTLQIALDIKEKYNIEPLVHFTCVGSDRKDIEEYLNEVKDKGIDNILALRGDPPAGETKFTPAPDGFSYANELISYIKKINGFHIAVAGYPEGHSEAADIDRDTDNLKKKVDEGAEFILTQLFFDNEKFYRFMDIIRKKGITIPVVPGIMPITSFKQIEKITEMSKTTEVPSKLMEKLKLCPPEQPICDVGIEYTINQCIELKKWGVPGLHLYSLNKSGALKKILDAMDLE